LLMFLAAFGIANGDVLDELDRGHRLIIEHGLQLQALVLDNETFDAQTWEDSNYSQFLGYPQCPLAGRCTRYSLVSLVWWS